MDALMPHNPLWTPGPGINVSVHALPGVGCLPSAGAHAGLIAAVTPRATGPYLGPRPGS